MLMYKIFTDKWSLAPSRVVTPGFHEAMKQQNDVTNIQYYWLKAYICQRWKPDKCHQIYEDEDMSSVLLV